jgi:hypothetical protein
MSTRHRLATEMAAVVKGSGRWKRANCGFCELRGLGFDHRGNWCLRSDGYYHCFRCKVKGWLPGTAPDDDEDREFDPGAVEYVPGRQILAGEADDSIGAPEGFVRLVEMEDDFEVKRAIRYCASRGISRANARDAHVGTCLDGLLVGRVVVPVLKGDGRTWAGWVARQFAPTRRWVPKYRAAEGMDTAQVLFNQHALLVETDEPLMVCEGAFDALPYFPHAVACLGKPKEPQIEFLLDTRRPLVITLDGDAWLEGRMLAMRLAFMGLEQPVGWVRLPPNSDPNSVDRGWLRTECRRAIAKSAHAGQNPGTNAL